MNYFPNIFRHLIGYLEIAEECDLIFLMLGYPQDLEDLLLGNEGIIQFMKPGSILVDHTTSSPALATLIAKVPIYIYIYIYIYIESGRRGSELSGRPCLGWGYRGPKRGAGGHGRWARGEL